MSADTPKLAKLGQIECVVRARDGSFKASITIDGTKVMILEGRIPMLVSADKELHEAVHVLAEAVVTRMVGVLAPGAVLHTKNVITEHH